MLIKICGITNREDAEAAVAAGSDAIGLIFAPSPRRVTPEQAAGIVKGLRGVLKIGVFVDESPEVIAEIRRCCALDALQLHGHESPETCRRLGGLLIKAFRVDHESVFARFVDYPAGTLFLLDAFSRQAAGGTGKVIDPAILDQCPDFSRVILAGGVGVENAASLVDRYAPLGLDANSRLELAPGKKDHDKMREFVQAVRAAERLLRAKDSVQPRGNP
ncbi:MAG: phosphoribosylanthranilate isomerase [candidate division KSB1 bacterium]|nr:phosphoribosylanthranilate isomerase [candidate division KSB1 bacterium]